MRVRSGLVCLLALTLSACGSGSGGQSSQPRKCSDVWVKGTSLPSDYRGCIEQDLVRPTTVRCTKDKGHTLVTYDGTNGLYVAMPGQKIDFYPYSVAGEMQSYGFTC